MIFCIAGDGQTTLAAGQHAYHFSFQIPQNIPCSIEHQYGHVRYTVKAILDRPWRFDHKVVSAFTVIAPYDLNTQQSLGVSRTRRSFVRSFSHSFNELQLPTLTNQDVFSLRLKIYLVLGFSNYCFVYVNLFLITIILFLKYRFKQKKLIYIRLLRFSKNARISLLHTN